MLQLDPVEPAPPSGPPITGPELRRIMDAARVVRGSHRPPSGAAYATLAERVTELRNAWFLCALGDAPATERAERIAGVLETLAELLPATRPELLRAGVLDNLKALDTLADAVRTARLCPWAAHAPQHRQVERWHDVAADLAAQFQVAMRSTNPTVELRVSNSGPIARFVAALIPTITGDRPTLVNVARFLQRHGENG